MSEWREVETGGECIRWREGSDHGLRDSPPNYRLEYWHPIRREWRGVRDMNARSWFAIGIEVGRTMQEQTEMAL